LLRKLIIGLFIVTSLTAQASAAFACRTINQLLDHRCCQEVEATADGAACCTQLVVIADQAGAHAPAKLPQPDLTLDAPILVVAGEIALPHAVRAYAWTVPPPLLQAGSLIYLRTQRLRI
jgi:hypothetical protein